MSEQGCQEVLSQALFAIPDGYLCLQLPLPLPNPSLSIPRGQHSGISSQTPPRIRDGKWDIYEGGDGIGQIQRAEQLPALFLT